MKPRQTTPVMLLLFLPEEEAAHPTSTKDSLTQHRDMPRASCASAPLCNTPCPVGLPCLSKESEAAAELWHFCPLAEPGGESCGAGAVGRSAVTRRVMMQLEGPCDRLGAEEEEERRLAMSSAMSLKSDGDMIWIAARLETHVRFSLSTNTSCLSAMLPAQ